MIILETIDVAFTMFSAIPMPQIPWTRDNMRYTLCAFPLIGAVIGLACWTAWAVCGFFGVPGILTGAVLCLIPVLITGGIHLDGYADTCDALASHAAPERKQEILKDPHVGSFAVIRLCGLFVLTLALWTSLPEYRTLPILLGFCVSRTLSGLAVASFPLAKDTGLAHTFAEAADRRRVRAGLIVLDVLLCAGMLISGIGGGCRRDSFFPFFIFLEINNHIIFVLRNVERLFNIFKVAVFVGSPHIEKSPHFESIVFGCTEKFKFARKFRHNK